MRGLHLYNDSPTFDFDVNLTDANDGITRRIDRLQLSANGDTTLTLFSTRVRFIVGGEGGTATLNLGSQNVGYIELLGDTNTVNGGTGGIVSLNMFNAATNTVTLNGNTDSITWDDADTTLTLNDGFHGAITGYGESYSVTSITVGEGAFVGSLRVDEGADRLTLTGGYVLQAVLGSGANTVNVNGGRIDQLTTYEGNDRVTITSGRINSINVSDGDNRVVTGDQWTTSISAYDGRDTVIVGSGGAGAVQVGGGRNVVTTTTGFVDYINTQNEVDVVTIGAGNALTVVTSGGNDRINATGGRVDFIDAGAGGDLVALGAGGARFVVLGDGNDTIKVAAFNPIWGVEIQGDAGIDTLAFTGFDIGVTFSLDVSHWQNPGAPGGDPNAIGTGYVAAIHIENLTGSGGSDSLTGDNARNVLTGGGGLDSLYGLDGNDRLIGGRQADLLTGGVGRDTFVFNPNEGIDRIADFVAGQDTIELLAANNLSDLTFQQIGTDVRIVFQQNTIFVANTTVAVMNDIDNFVF